MYVYRWYELLFQDYCLLATDSKIAESEVQLKKTNRLKQRAVTSFLFVKDRNRNVFWKVSSKCVAKTLWTYTLAWQKQIKGA
jgi:hypothetical protein